jgi:hypothetical protein
VSLPEKEAKLSHEFDQEIENMIASLLNERSANFDSIVTALPGVYPAEVVKGLSRLARRREAPSALIKRIKYQASVPDGRPAARRQPVPHLADYDWPFSPEAETVIADLVWSSASRGSVVALLGAPRLAEYLSANSEYRLVVVDNNELALNALTDARATLTRLDITKDKPPDVMADVVVLDPPWYEDYFRSFLWFASKICIPGSQVIMSFPPIGTRPGICEERERILSWARRAGFKRIHQAKSALTYETPHFERNALASVGIYRVPLYWREGDLVVVQATGELTDRDLKRPAPPFDKTDWNEIEIEGIRVKLRSQGLGWIADPRLQSIVPGDVFPSVSRREPRRRRIDVWTSGNRVFRCRNTALLGCLIPTLSEETSTRSRAMQVLGRPPTKSEREILSEAASQFEALIRVEREDSPIMSSSEAPEQA